MMDDIFDVFEDDDDAAAVAEVDDVWLTTG